MCVNCGEGCGAGGTSIVKPKRSDKFATGKAGVVFSAERGDSAGLESFAPRFSDAALFSILFLELLRPRAGPRGARTFGEDLGAVGAADGPDRVDCAGWRLNVVVVVLFDCATPAVAVALDALWVVLSELLWLLLFRPLLLWLLILLLLWLWVGGR